MNDQVEHAAAHLRAAERIVWLTGAGISVASGIAPYRGSSDAVWSRFVTEWGTIARFRADRASWWTEYWLKAHGDLVITPDKYKPNAGHLALTQILQARPLDTLITQNIDGLHRAAGAPEERLIEVHGRHDRFCCTNGRCIGTRDLADRVDLSGLPAGEAPRCTLCRAAMRPVVLLFDEQYASHPLYRWEDARRALKNADAIVFVGTSFAVGITQHALDTGRRALRVNINTASAKDFGVDILGLRMLELLGPSEETLPALMTLLVQVL